MSCEETRRALQTASPEEIRALPHLAECADCRALADALLARHADLDRALAAFADAREAPQSEPIRPANRPWRWRMTPTSLILAAATAATVALGVRTAWTPPANAPASEICALTDALEAAALEGRLTDAQIACLEAKGDGSSKANRVLLVNAWSADDQEAWRAIATRELDRERRDGDIDVDLVYKVALWDSRHADWDGVIRGVEDALPHVGDWPDDVREKRTTSLYKLRAAAGAKLAEASDDPALAEQAARWAREWRERDPE
ncbi:MAG: hypothetical protein H6737_01340 [Alphaproteobacteria bacterium]|nr:hypothetical protein [Alphaproteobacteria bacterium]